MSACIPTVLTPEEHSTVLRRVSAKLAGLLTPAVRCQACNKMLGPHELRVKGHVSRQLLGLCRPCSRFVNVGADQ